MKKLLMTIAVCLPLAGCAGNPGGKDVEVPSNDHPEGIDEERVSPCACVEYSNLEGKPINQPLSSGDVS